MATRKHRAQRKPRAPLFAADEREALRPPRHLKCSEWTELHRVLPVGASDIPGLWRNDNAPYLRGIMDLPNVPGVERLDIQKAGQIGVSEALTNDVLFWAHTDPDPCGLALPDRVKGRRIVTDRLIPAILHCRPVADLMTTRKWDLSSEEIKLTNGFQLSLMWSGSSTSTSSTPMRRVIDDEVDKFALWAGRETNPVGRTWTRTRSYGARRLQINCSTPSDRLGEICRLIDEDAVQLLFMCPCPGCGEYQYLTFRQLRWLPPPKKLAGRERQEFAARLIADKAVWYECIRCKRRIEPMERPAMVRAGLWRTEDGTIPDAEAVEEWPRGTRIGMRVNALVCLWESWEGIAAEFLRAEGDRERMFSFRTETLGEPWEDQVERPHASVYADKVARADHAPGQVPDWAVKLLCSIDTQHDHFYVVLRAWGPEMRSQRVFHGRVESFHELDDLCFQHVWPFAGERSGGMRPELVLIDSGGTRLEGEPASRTMQVYQWALRRRARVRAVKGASAISHRREGLYLWPGKGVLDTEGQDSRPRKSKKRRGPELRIWYLDTHHFGDLLADLVMQGVGEDDERPEAWLLNAQADEDYDMQLSNVQKRLLRSRSGPPQEVWEPIESGAPVHYWDCEVYQIAAAYMARVHMLPTAEELEEYRKAMAKEQAAQRPATVTGQRPASQSRIRAHY